MQEYVAHKTRYLFYLQVTSTPSATPTMYCDDFEGWFDFYNNTCEYYETDDDPGCPNEGHIANNETNITANEAW